MKKYFYLLAFLFIGGFVVSSCTTTEYVDDGIDYDTYSVVYDVTGRNFTPNNNYSSGFTFPSNLNIQSSDMVLVYRQKGSDNGNPVWEMIPRTIYLSGGNELDYDFDFTINDVLIYVDGTDLLNTPSGYLIDQNFRVVVVPASYGNKIDLTDYNKVIQYYNIDDSKAVKL